MCGFYHVGGEMVGMIETGFVDVLDRLKWLRYWCFWKASLVAGYGDDLFE